VHGLGNICGVTQSSCPSGPKTSECFLNRQKAIVFVVSGAKAPQFNVHVLARVAKHLLTNPNSWNSPFCVGNSCDITIIIRGLFEKLVDWRQCAAVMLLSLPLRKSGALPPVHELFKCPSYLLRHPEKGSLKTTVTQTLTTDRGMKITPLLRYPHHHNLA
jgi:hypothetical protein